MTFLHAMRLFWRLRLVVLLFCAFGIEAQAQVARSQAVGAATVTAARSERNLTAAAPVQRFDSTSMRRLGLTDTGDALRRMAGTTLRDYGGAGGLKTVSVRGLGAGHTAVSYDGVCLTDARNGAIDLSAFSLDRLESIALHTLDRQPLLTTVRELAAAVVELRTAMPTEASRSAHGNATLRAAAWGTVSPSLYVARRMTPRLAYNLSARFFTAKNDYPFRVENGVATHTERRVNSEMQTWSAEGGVLYNTSRSGTIATKAYLYHTERHLPGAVTLYTNTAQEKQRDSKLFLQSRWEQRYGAWQLQAAAKADCQHSSYYDYGGAYPEGFYKEDYQQTEGYAHFGASRPVLADYLHLAYATDFSLTHLKSNLAENNRATRLASLHSLSLRAALGRLTMTARGVGHGYVDRTRTVGTASAGAVSTPLGRRTTTRFAPAATLSYSLLRPTPQRPRSLTLRGGYKEMFRLPTFTEQYYYHYGQRALRPELTRQLGLGATLALRPAAWWPQFALTLDAYRNRVSQRIVFVPINLHVWRAMNLGRVNAHGLDATLTSQYALAPRHQLFLSASYTLQRVVSVSNDAPSLQLAYTPLHSGAASLAYEGPLLGLAAHATFSASRWATIEHTAGTQLPSYAELGLALYRSFRLSGLRLDARFDVVNALNAHYEVVRRYPMPGRAWKLSAAVHF